MCETKNPPKYIWKQGVKQKVDFKGFVSLFETSHTQIATNKKKYENGVYLVVSTGSYYAYFDGISFTSPYVSHDLLCFEE